jgi:hypothetical protein
VLKRSPTSKYLSLVTSAGIVIILIIIFTTINTWRSETLNHGKRIKYYSTNSNFYKGEEISISDLITHEMYSKDAPKNSIKASELDINRSLYANFDIPKNSILQKNMLVKTIESTLDEDSRIIFIPTNDKITSELAQYADIIATLPDGYGSEVIAYEAKILFDAKGQVSNNDSTENTDSQNAGYFVQVTSEEAQSISTALSTGDLHFALKKSIDS